MASTPKESRAQSPAPKAKAADTKEAIQKVKDSRMEITDDGLAAIKAWKYKGGTYTPIDTFLNKFVWVPTAALLPDWLAPNAVTLIGLLWVVAGYVVMCMGYSTDLFKPAPSWVYVFAAVANFIYQTLDACDGKHARRLGASSALGQLFDHGCDSVSLTFIAMTIVSAARMGFGVRAVILLFSFQVPFWLSQWAEYHTHMMEHSLGGWLGITEGQLVGIFVMFLPAVAGTEFFLMDLGIGNAPAWYCGGEPCAITIREPFLLAQCIVAMIFACTNFYTVLTNAKHVPQAMMQAVPILLLMVLGIAWCTTIPHASTHPRLVIFSLGMAFTFLCNKMIVAGMCRMEYKTFHTILVPLPIIYIVSYFRLLPRHDDVLLGGYCAYSVYKLQKYTRNVVQEISHHLGIYVLALGKRENKAD